MGATPRRYRPDRPIVPELSAGAVVRLVDTRQILLLHDARGQRWCLPKGHVDPGESLTQAAEREVREETGLSRVSLRGEIRTISYRFYDADRGLNVSKTCVYFDAVSRDPDTRLEPIFDRCGWLDAPSALRRLKYEGERDVLRRSRGGRPAMR